VCADPTPAKPAAAGVDYAAEPLYSVADYAANSAAALTETS
jgi:hypothetical protein